MEITSEQLAEFAQEIIRGTLAGIGLNAPMKKQTITRGEMVNIIGRRRFENAIAQNKLRVHKRNPDAVNSTMYAFASDWQKFIKSEML